MSDTLATSFGVLNYSGMLFNKGNTRCPLSSIIGGRAKTTNHVEFVTGQEYTTGGGAQPSISETASLTAPEASVITRTQKTNVTQIFMEAVGISYAKQSNMGTLSGLNVANQQANPINELDFQVAAKMQKVNRDIEFTFIQGTYNKATQDSEVNKTRGLVEAVTTNTKAMSSKPLGLWDIADMVKKIYGANAPTDGLCLWCDATTLFQVNADAVQNGLTVVPAAREINGIALSSVVTPIGVVYLYLGECLPAGTALLLNLNVIAPVYQPVPGKGNFFLEPLAKTGAGEKYQLFGQIGLDHGPEWYHGKFTGIGFNHDDKVSGGKAAYSFQLVDCLNQTQQMNTSNTNTGSWNGSAMRGRMSTYKSQLPAALRNVIKTVKKKSGTGGGSSSGTQQTNDDLFLLSEIEIFGTTTYSVAGEGTQYEWYKAGNTKVKKVNGSADFWWERSPYSGGTNYFCAVSSNGSAGNHYASNSFGVSFGFCV